MKKPKINVILQAVKRSIINDLRTLDDEELLKVKDRFPELLEELHPPFCPDCGIDMRPRVGKYGKFWGCSGYPICKGSRQFKCNGNHSIDSTKSSQRDEQMEYLLSILQDD